MSATVSRAIRWTKKSPAWRRANGGLAHIGKGPVYHAPNRNLSIGFLLRNHLIESKMCFGARIMCHITFQRRIRTPNQLPLSIKMLVGKVFTVSFGRAENLTSRAFQAKLTCLSNRFRLASSVCLKYSSRTFFGMRALVGKRTLTCIYST
jgi:hypothetical protein